MIMAYAFARALDQAMLLGDGTAAYGNITGILNQTTVVSAPALTAGHTTVATLDMYDWLSVDPALAAEYARKNARWILSGTVSASARAMRTGLGVNPIWERGATAEESTLCYYPYTFCQEMPAAGSVGAGQPYGVFGDVRRAMMLGMLDNIAIDTSDQAMFLSDCTVVRGLAYADIEITDAKSVVIAKTHA
jgi:HK97 family phage major capsid protein